MAVREIKRVRKRNKSNKISCEIMYRLYYIKIVWASILDIVKII